jgi:hypothetical protein
MTDDGNMWTLFMKNHEDIGITDNQFIETLWNFVNVYTNRMIEQKLFEIKKEEAIPEAQAVITHNKRYTLYNVIVQAVEKPITQANFMLILGQLCQNLANQAGIVLKGLEGRGVQNDSTL